MKLNEEDIELYESFFATEDEWMKTAPLNSDNLHELEKKLSSYMDSKYKTRPKILILIDSKVIIDAIDLFIIEAIEKRYGNPKENFYNKVLKDKTILDWVNKVRKNIVLDENYLDGFSVVSHWSPWIKSNLFFHQDERNCLATFFRQESEWIKTNSLNDIKNLQALYEKYLKYLSSIDSELINYLPVNCFKLILIQEISKIHKVELLKECCDVIITRKSTESEICDNETIVEWIKQSERNLKMESIEDLYELGRTYNMTHQNNAGDAIASWNHAAGKYVK